MDIVMICLAILTIAWLAWPDYPYKPSIHDLLAKEVCEEEGIYWDV